MKKEVTNLKENKEWYMRGFEERIKKSHRLRFLKKTAIKLFSRSLKSIRDGFYNIL